MRQASDELDQEGLPGTALGHRALVDTLLERGAESDLAKPKSFDGLANLPDDGSADTSFRCCVCARCNPARWRPRSPATWWLAIARWRNRLASKDHMAWAAAMTKVGNSRHCRPVVAFGSCGTGYGEGQFCDDAVPRLRFG